MIAAFLSASLHGAPAPNIESARRSIPHPYYGGIITTGPGGNGGHGGPGGIGGIVVGGGNANGIGIGGNGGNGGDSGDVNTNVVPPYSFIGTGPGGNGGHGGAGGVGGTVFGHGDANGIGVGGNGGHGGDSGDVNIGGKGH